MARTDATRAAASRAGSRRSHNASTDIDPTDIDPTDIDPTDIDPTKVDPSKSDPTEFDRTEVGATVAAGRAAQELNLKRGEFELAVHLGIVRIAAAEAGGRPRVSREEIDRLRSGDGFPDAVRERVRTVGTAEGARLLGISPVRFTRLARAGCITPVAFYLNRYRAIVWLYLAQELLGFAAGAPQLLTGNSPAWMRTCLGAGSDWRTRNWRSHRIERLLRRTEDPWARAAVLACALDPVQLAEVVDDPYERAYLRKVQPGPVFGPPGSVAARDTVTQLMRADDPDEILWRRVNLDLELDSAREARPAPHPEDDRRPDPDCSVPVSVPVPPPVRDSAPVQVAGLLNRLGLRRREALRGGGEERSSGEER
ncbi:DUF6397 family protein [Streptomyces sp. NPDC051020]|uniref:DUF6397 family protein n=1 Tax=Streptomyces sp. NPDC051020 TaxID=3155409 RepID=UPI00343AE013